ncbi:hypothetical protein [Paracoccus alkenifer]|uniref:Uncharacterized protein n=1 Tax=Paracoccus alkenifer TaxID=65735 RepID=A0A1H6N641_9RHOB|nr:hypothetical protein [Paracoccus alkenifer]SEI10181.1 hypothetical protein SAMN04488075_2877 [Paracoccus alkenifer]
MSFGIALNTTQGFVDISAANPVRLIAALECLGLSGSVALPVQVLPTDKLLFLPVGQGYTPTITRTQTTVQWVGVPPIIVGGVRYGGTTQDFRVYFSRQA